MRFPSLIHFPLPLLRAMSEANIQAGVNKSSASRSGRNRPIEVKNKQPADVQVRSQSPPAFLGGIGSSRSRK